jgi:hypothetical protein|nr:MAG TPA: hypothetical protein [Caudoviricetes sp.]
MHYRIEKKYNSNSWELDRIEPTLELAKRWLGLKKLMFIKIYDTDNIVLQVKHIRVFKLTENNLSFKIELKNRKIEYRIVKVKE